VNFTVDGRQVFAYTAAHAVDPAKRTVVFVHGAGSDHSAFGLQSRYFGYHGRNVLALDLPAHGRSAGPALPTIADMTDWTMRLLDAAKLDRASIVGHSMGALVALECAARHPARVEHIALLGMCYPMKVSEAFLNAAKEDRHEACDMLTIWGHAPQAPLGANPSPGMWMLGDVLARVERLGAGVLYADLLACHSYAGGEAAAENTKCPALFVLARRDQMTPLRVGVDFAKRIPQARIVRLDTSGHFVMTEGPDATLGALKEFLA